MNRIPYIAFQMTSRGLLSSNLKNYQDAPCDSKTTFIINERMQGFKTIEQQDLCPVQKMTILNQVSSLHSSRYKAEELWV